MAITSHVDIGREIVNSEWGREGGSAEQIIPFADTERLHLGLQAYTAYLLRDILQELKLLTEPAKEKNLKEGCERVDRQTAMAITIHTELREKFKSDIGPISAQIIKRIKPFPYGTGAEWARELRRADYFLKHPAEKWGDKELLRVRAVGKITLRKFREEIERVCTKAEQK